MCARGAPIVRRIAVLYALLDGEALVRASHLQAALAAWRYAEDSARYVFGDRLGQPADKLRALIYEAGEAGVSREQIRNHVGGRHRAAEIEEALRLLAELGLARSEKRSTGGRPQERGISLEHREET